MPPVEIYTTRFCPYCSAAKALLTRKGVSFREIDVSSDFDRRDEMIQRANGRMTVPQIFIGTTHVGGSDELHALEDAGRLDPLLAGKGSVMNGGTFKAAMIQMRSGLQPGRQSRCRRALDRRGEIGRRRLRADAGNDQHHGGQARAAVRGPSRKRPTPRWPRCASWRASSASTCTSVRWRSRSRPTRPPIVPS